jgi:hypothetical protein
MTLESLDAWVAAPGQSVAEKRQRQRLANVLTVKPLLKPRKLLERINDLDLTNQPNLTSLPDGLTVRGSLFLCGLYSLKSLPRGLTVGGNMDAGYCTSLTQVPVGLVVAGDLHLTSCTSLTRLPEGLLVGGSLSVAGCTALLQLPRFLTVGGDLNAFSCLSLRQVSEGLYVGGELGLKNCRSLLELPTGLCIRDALYLDHCISLRHLPEDLTFTGLRNILSVWGCTSLTQLPDSVVRCFLHGRSGLFFCHMNDSGIPDGYVNRAIARIEAANDHFTHRLQNERAGQSAQVADSGQEVDASQGGQSTVLAFAIDFWRALAFAGSGRDKLDGVAAQNLHADLPQLASFVTFLHRLRETADYKNMHSRHLFAQRVVGLIAQIAASKDLAALCHERIGEALESCGDRVSWAMNQLELAVRVHLTERSAAPEQELRSLGRSLLRLQVVHQHAAVKVERLKKADPIEIYLAFESKLAKLLDLPLSTREMLYERTANVSKGELKAATRAAQHADADPRQVEAFFAAWQPWQDFTRRQQAAACTWQGLPAMPYGARLDGTELCILTQESVADLQAGGSQVAAMQDPRGEWEAYDFKALLEWWAQHGTHPVRRSPMPLEIIHRVEALPAPPSLMDAAPSDPLSPQSVDA